MRPLVGRGIDITISSLRSIFSREFCPKENEFFFEGKWNFFRTKRLVCPDKNLTLPKEEVIIHEGEIKRHSLTPVNAGYAFIALEE